MVAAIQLKLRAIFQFNGGDARAECLYMNLIEQREHSKHPKRSRMSGG
jgi:hypothetical protein